jgi:hypothetical protein
METNSQLAPIEIAFSWFKGQRDRMNEDNLEAALRFFPFAIVQELGMLPEVTAASYDKDILPWTEEAMRGYLAGIAAALPTALLEHRRVRIARLLSRALPPLIFLGQQELAKETLHWLSYPILGAPVAVRIATFAGSSPDSLGEPVLRMAAGNACNEGCEMCAQARPAQRA